jgi:hypothetical protein
MGKGRRRREAVEGKKTKVISKVMVEGDIKGVALPLTLRGHCQCR